MAAAVRPRQLFFETLWVYLFYGLLLKKDKILSFFAKKHKKRYNHNKTKPGIIENPRKQKSDKNRTFFR